MIPALRKLVLGITRLLLRLRYRIQVDGLDSLDGMNGSTLVLPNHPAYIDPVMVLTEVRLPTGPLRPVVYTETYRIPAFYPLMRIVDAVEVPDLRRTRRAAAQETRELIEAMISSLHQGQNFLMYPSGRLQRDDQEKLGNARMTHDLLSRCADINIVLVRIRGVWGSVFSCAQTGGVPDLSKIVWLGFPRLLGSLVLFLPRREVSIYVERVDAAFLATLDRNELNDWLEDWYNHDGGESPKYVPYHVLKRRKASDEDQDRRGRSTWRRWRNKKPKDGSPLARSDETEEPSGHD